MTVSQRIRADYGTVKRFAKLNSINYLCLCAALSGRTEYATINKILMEKGLIQSVDDLRKVA